MEIVKANRQLLECSRYQVKINSSKGHNEDTTKRTTSHYKLRYYINLYLHKSDFKITYFYRLSLNVSAHTGKSSMKFNLKP